jgi:pilus assembly protein CpaC
MWPSQKYARCLAAGLALLFLFSAPLRAAPRELQLDVSRGQLVNLAQPAGSVFVADPNIAGVQVPSDRQIFVFGKKPGQTTLFVLGEDGKQIASMIINVRTPVAGAQSAVENVAPGAVHITGANNGLDLRGTVATPETGSQAGHAAAATLPKELTLRNDAKVLTSAQVTLRVRIAEVDRSVIKALGFNWNEATKVGQFTLGAVIGRQTFTNTPPIQFIPDSAAGSPGSIIFNGGNRTFSTQTVIDALADEGLVTLLAEPTLTALSGEPASFLAGGEFPIPIAQPSATGGATISVTYKEFGVSLNFVPTVVSANRISLHVKPEVSQLVTSGAGSVEVAGFNIPGLTVRRAETTIELGSGESFAIAGLLQNTTNTNVSNYPGLADLPILGPLFRSTNFARNESELVVVVTPYITEPIADPRALRLPTDGLAPPNDIDLILRGRVAARNPTSADGAAAASANSDTPHLAGDAGFDIE